MQESLGQWHDYVVLTDRLLCESNEADLALHQAELQEAVLQLALNVLRKAESQLRNVVQLWERQGPGMVKEIREAFPLTQAPKEDKEPREERAPESDASEAPAEQKPADVSPANAASAA